MTEASFIRQNYEKWQKIELMIDDKLFTTPDEISEGYTDIMADLAFARTHFPDSRIVGYLNHLALAVHNSVYQHHPGRWRHVVHYWTHDIPLAVYENRKALLAALVVFVVGYLIGVGSTLGDASFPELILGRDYMEVTEENIQAGEPMGIYGSQPHTSMFLCITLNNLNVAFYVFVMGVFTSIFTGIFLLKNAIIIGAFHAFFFQRGLLGSCLLATMLHGTLELSSIVIAGGAGFVLGNGWLFPGTYSRTRSFLVAGRHSIKLLVSTIPIFIVAAFIEGFLTRYTHIGNAFRLLVIFGSAAFIVFYYVLLPIKRHRDVSPR